MTTDSTAALIRRLLPQGAPGRLYVWAPATERAAIDRAGVDLARYALDVSPSAAAAWRRATEHAVPRTLLDLWELHVACDGGGEHVAGTTWLACRSYGLPASRDLTDPTHLHVLAFPW